MTTQPNGNSQGVKPPSNSFSQTTVLSVGYVTVSVVSAVMVARIVLLFMRPKKLAAEDYCVFVAYAFFVSQCALYITIAPVSDRVMAVQEGRAPYYPELIDEGFLLGRLYFPALIIFWVILWLVKFGLLFLYRKLMVGMPTVYTRIWWSIVAFCAITEVGNFVCYIESCETIKGFFNGGCHDRKRQFMSVWYSYAADTLTNIMIMAFPLYLIWNLQMPRRKKAGIVTLFASGILCIIIATLRAVQITLNTIRTNADTDGTWLAVWGMAECAVAVVIGLTPSFAILIHVRRNNSKSPYNRNEYVKQDGQEFQLQTIGGTGGPPTRSRKRPTNTWIDLKESQEELAGKTDNASVSTSMRYDEESLGTAK